MRGRAGVWRSSKKMAHAKACSKKRPRFCARSSSISPTFHWARTHSLPGGRARDLRTLLPLDGWWREASSPIGSHRRAERTDSWCARPRASRCRIRTVRRSRALAAKLGDGASSLSRVRSRLDEGGSRRRGGTSELEKALAACAPSIPRGPCLRAQLSPPISICSGAFPLAKTRAEEALPRRRSGGAAHRSCPRAHRARARRSPHRRIVVGERLTSTACATTSTAPAWRPRPARGVAELAIEVGCAIPAPATAAVDGAAGASHRS